MTNAIILEHVKRLEVAINYMCVEGRGLGRKGFKEEPCKSEFEAKVASWIGVMVCWDEFS